MSLPPEEVPEVPDASGVDGSVGQEDPKGSEKKHNHHGHHGHGNHEGQPHGHDGPKPKHTRKFGISYSPYTAAGTCKSQDQVDQDVNAISANDGDSYAFIRIYGIDCNQTAMVASAAQRHNMQVFAGLFDLTDFPHSLDTIIDAAHTICPTPNPENPQGNDGWKTFHTITIGNELVQKHAATIPQVVDAIHAARSILRDAGYKGPVVTVDTYPVLLAHPELCEASDYCATNCHVFFDATQTAQDAGVYARDVARRISDATISGHGQGNGDGKYDGSSGGKRKKTLIAESGWPHAGYPNGKAVPSMENQRVAIESLKKLFSNGPHSEEHDDQNTDADGEDGLVLFTAFDDLWKEDGQGTFGAEKFWGIHN